MRIGTLLDVVSVVRTEGSFGTASYEIDAPGKYLNSTLYDICNPSTESAPLTGEHPLPDGECAPTLANVFAVETEFQARAMRSGGNERDVVGRALDVEAEKAAAVTFWGNSTDGLQVSMFGPDTNVVAAGTDVKASVTAAIEDFWSRATGVGYSDTVVHLGLESFLAAANDLKVLVDTLGLKIAVSFGYPLDAVGVTGPVLIKFGSDDVLLVTDPHDNTKIAQASRLGSIEFDPTIAVRVS